MKSFNTYAANKHTYFTSLSSRIENPINHDILSLIKEHGSYIDSIMHKLDIHSYRIKNSNYILESDQDVLLDIEEQYAARDIFVNICESYEASLYKEFCIENNLDIDIEFVNEGIKDTFNNISNIIKDKSKIVKDKFNELSDKVKGIKEFIAEILKKGIKSIKDLLGKFEELMIKIGESLKSILDKLTNKHADSYHDFFIDGCKDAFKDELKSKEIQKQYEALQNKLLNDKQITESEIYEFLNFGKKKNKEDSKKLYGNEYEAALNAKPGTEKSLKDNIIVKIFLQVAIHWFITYGVATLAVIAIPGLGPAFATIYLPIANALWAGVSAFKTYKQIKKQVFETDEFKKLPKGKKIFTAVLWFVSLALAAYSAYNAGGELFGIAKHFWTGGTLENLIPAESVVNLSNKFNEFWKSIGGKGFKNVDAMNDKITEFGGMGIKGAVEKTEETINAVKAEIGETGEKLLKASSEIDFKNSMANVDWMKSHGLPEDSLINNLSLHDKLYIYCDGAFSPENTWSRTVMDIAGTTNAKHVLNTSLNNINPNAGSSSVIELTVGDFLQAKDAGCLGANGHYAIIGAVQSKVDVITNTVSGFIGRNLGFSGLMPIVQKYMKGGFKVRLGSNRTHNHLYNVPDETWIQEVPYNKFINDFSKLNPKAIKEMKKYVDENIKIAEKNKADLENKNNLKRADKKHIKTLNKFIEQFKEGKSEIKILVFCTDDKFADMGSSEPNEKPTNESLDFNSIISEGILDFLKKDKNNEETDNKQDKDNKSKSSGEKYPIFFFNPITLCGGDLTRRTNSKGPRAHIYLAKGLLSRLEFITVNDGMSGKAIVEMFGKFISDSLNASYKMTVDVPCIKKEGEKEWIANPESKNKGKERMDFGGFTNEQIATFMNNPNKVTDFLGGQHATDTISGGKHKYIEQDDTHEKKKHNEEVKKQFADLLTKNKELKDFIKDECKTINKSLYDKNGNLKEDVFENLVSALMRIENTYLNGDNKHNIFKKIKNLFKKDNIELDPSEVKKLSLKVASLRKTLKKQRYEEGLDDNNYNDIILEANIEILENEFEQIWENN